MSVILTFQATLVSSLGRLYPAFPAKNRSLYLVSEKQKIHNKSNNNTTTKNHPTDKKTNEYMTMSRSFPHFASKLTNLNQLVRFCSF